MNSIAEMSENPFWQGNTHGSPESGSQSILARPNSVYVEGRHYVCSHNIRYIGQADGSLRRVTPKISKRRVKRMCKGSPRQAKIAAHQAIRAWIIEQKYEANNNKGETAHG